jgi:hypothetical protein
MTEAFYGGPQSPGSVKEFAASRGYDSADGRVFAEHSAALAQYRLELAEARGITLEELHQGPVREVGRISFIVSSEAAPEQNVA